MLDLMIRESDPLLKPLESHYTGPTWQRKLDGTWNLPGRKQSLAWDLFDWFEENVASPDGELDEDGNPFPFIPTDEQARFLLWWYAVDQNGVYNYRNGVLRRMKGWGKDPLVAAMALAELCGPVHFKGYDAYGNVKGTQRPAAWVQIAAVTQEQTENTFLMFPIMITPQMVSTYGLEVQKTMIRANGGRLLQSVTSNPKAVEGKRTTFVIMNEIQWWIEANRGHDMYNKINGNITKRAGMGARYLAICNAHVPGEESVGEMMWDTFQKVQGGESVDTKILYDSVEAPAGTPLSEIPPQAVDPEGFKKGVQMLYEGLRVARGDSTFMSLDPIVLSCLDRNNAESESRRQFLNQVDASEDSWIAPWEWDACQLSEAVLHSGDKITLGFDGSKSNDYTALVACRVSDGCLFVINVWNPKNFQGTVPYDQVDDAVAWCFGRFNVVAFRADMKEFESYVQKWTTQYKKKLQVKASPDNPIAFDMRGQTKRFAFDCEAFKDAVLQGGLLHNGSTILRTHVTNAHLNPTIYDAISIRKASKDSSRKIDAAVCAVLAYSARQDYLMKGTDKTGRMVILS